MKLSAKFRVKEGVPFSIETVSGTQYRCGICGKIFYERKDLDKHLLTEKNKDFNCLKFPGLNENIFVKVIYTQDIRDRTNQLYPRLKKGDRIFKLNSENKK